MFLFYSFMHFLSKCVNKCLHENEFLQVSYVHILSYRCRTDVGIYVGADVSMSICRQCFRTLVFVAREHLS